MTDKEKIRKELIRLKDKYYKRGEESDALQDGYAMYWGGVISTFNEIIAFVDSLPEEPVSEDLEEAAIEYCGGNKGVDARVRAGFIMGGGGRKEQDIKKACEWIKQQQDMLEDCFSDAGDFADLLKKAMEESK